MGLFKTRVPQKILFPTLTCGVFVFSSVSTFLRRLPPPVSHSLTHSLSHSLSLSHSPTHSLTHSLSHALTHSLTPLTHSLTQCAFCVAGVGQCALPRGWMYALASLGSPPLLRGRRGTMCTVKGSDVRPGVPWVSASFAWQAWDNVHCQGLGCTPWRPLGLRLFCVAGVGHCNVHCQGLGCTPWRPLGLRLFCVAGVGQCALPRVWMYALASLGSPPLLRGRRGTMCTAKGSDVRPGVPWVSAAFAWQAWDNVHCQGLGCTPWRPLGLRLFGVAGVAQCALPRARMYALGSLGSPPLLRGRRGTKCTAKGSDVRPGVPWVSASLAWQAWQGTMCTAKGSDVRPGVPWVSASFAWQAWVRPGVPWVSAAFAWQAWANVHCQGLGCTPWRPLGLRRFCVAGVAQCALPRARMYALASLGSPPLAFGRGRRGTMCTAKGLDVRPGVPWVSAAVAWQAWDNVHCQGVGCTPWRPLGLRRFCVAGVGQCALSRARMYALASLGSPPLWRGRRGTMCTAKGSDVRPGVPWVSASFAWQAWHKVHCQGLGCTTWRPLGLRLFGVAGVAGVAQCALPRARMYALASLGSPPLLRGRRGTMCTAKGLDVRPGVPWVSAAFAWQAWANVHCQGLGCTPWRPLGLRRFCVAGVAQCALPRARMYVLASLGSPPLLRGRRGTMCTAKGSDVRPGVPWVSASFAWQAWDNSLTRSLTHSLIHSLTHAPSHSLTHPLTHSLTLSLSLTHPLTHSLTHPLTHSLTSLTHPTPLHSTPLHFTSLHSTPLHSTPLHSLTHSLNLNIHTHTHKLTHHHRSITLIRPLPFLLFYAQSKSREVGNMWGYIRSFNFIVEFSCADALFENC